MSAYAWFLLILAGLTEVLWAFFMKQSNGFSKIIPSVLFIFFSIISLVALTISSKYIALSVAYAVWVSIGIVGTVLTGYLFFNESISLLKVLFLIMILTGVIGLKVFN